MADSVNDNTWLDFIPTSGPSCCGLCGNAGIVDTIGWVKSPSGEDCGVRMFCICPNGRQLKDAFLGAVPPKGWK